MPCFVIHFRDRHGSHQSTKWADKPSEALSLLKKAHSQRSCAVDYSTPVLMRPQPFSAEARESTEAFWAAQSHPGAVRTKPAGEIALFAADESELPPLEEAIA